MAFIKNINRFLKSVNILRSRIYLKFIIFFNKIFSTVFVKKEIKIYYLFGVLLWSFKYQQVLEVIIEYRTSVTIQYLLLELLMNYMKVEAHSSFSHHQIRDNSSLILSHNRNSRFSNKSTYSVVDKPASLCDFASLASSLFQNILMLCCVVKMDV